jgi:hypothetical protein
MAEITEKIRKKLLEVDDADKYPKWFREVLARRLLLILIPTLSSHNLPRWLSTIVNSPIDNWPPDVPSPTEILTPPTIPGFDPDQGPISPGYIDPWTPGPTRPPHTSPGGKEYAINIYMSSFGEMSNHQIGWSNCRAAAEASDGSSTFGQTFIAGRVIDYEDNDYSITRATLVFNFSEIPVGAEIIDAWLHMFSYEGDIASILIQTAPGAIGNLASDFSKTTGDASASITTDVNWNTWTLTASQKAYMSTKAGASCVLMSRENDHDFGNVAPIIEFKRSVFKSQLTPDPSLCPYLEIIYKA